jgi:glutamyl-tRNA synthetase
MNEPPVVTRFAPSPTGLLHAGNLRTALFNYLLGRRAGGRFILRIEDSDATRVDPEAEDAIQQDLQWLGMSYDVGPGRGDPSAWRQSARQDAYQAGVEALLAADQAYYCFCAVERLRALREAQQKAGQPPRYDGCCAAIDPDEAAARVAAGESATVRLRIPATGDLTYNDLVRGEQRFDAQAYGDPVIRRADGSVAFLFANALDDARMGVTHVLRGEDHLSNTPLQRQLLKGLGLAPPAYGHLSLVVDAHGAPLSKRSQTAGVAALRSQGYRPEAVLNYLARLGNPGLADTLLDMHELAERFAPERLSRSPARFDQAQLDGWQQQAMAAIPLSTLQAHLRIEVPANRLDGFLALVRPNLRVADEVNDWAVRIFSADWRIDSAAAAESPRPAAAFYETVARVIEATGTDDWAELRPALEAATERRGGAMMKPLRFALTGLAHGPALGEIIRLMPASVRRLRLQRAAAGAAGDLDA